MTQRLATIVLLCSVLSWNTGVAQESTATPPESPEVATGDDEESGAPEATIRVHWDCFLTTGVDCADLLRAFLAADPYLVRAASAVEADATIVVRAWDASPQFDRYEIEFIGAGSRPSFSLSGPPLHVRDALGVNARLLILVHHLVRGIAIYHDIGTYEVTPDGYLIVRYRTTDEAMPRPTRTRPWFVESDGHASLSSQGFVGVGAWGNTHFRFMRDRWAADVAAGVSYNYASLVGPDGTRTSASNLSSGGSATYVRSFAEHFSAASVLRVGHNRAANYDGRYQLDVGIEYERIPFIRRNDRNLTISYLIGVNFEDYSRETYRHVHRAVLSTHALSVNYTEHVAKLDLSISAGAASVVDRPRLFAVGVQASARVNLTTHFGITLGGNFGLKRNILNRPLLPNDEPVFYLLGVAGSVQAMTYSIDLSFQYVFGNTLLGNQDRRWRSSAISLPLNF